MSLSTQNTLIIDDEPAACSDLRRLLAAHREVAIVGESSRIADAQIALARPDYDLVFLDVQLRGGTGFDLVPHVRPGARIVFVTAHDNYALRAFAVNALDYLLKPVEPARLAESLRRLDHTATESTRPPASGLSLTRDDTVLLKTVTDVARFVRVGDLAAVFSNENYTEIRLVSGEKFIARRTLKAWEEQLPATDFMRVHRTALVNLPLVSRAAHHSREVTHLFLAGLGEYPVRARRELWSEIERRIGPLSHRLD